MTEDPATRLRENVTEVTATIVTGIWLVGLFAGQWWWLPALLVGYLVVVPLVALVYGDEEDRREWWWDDEDDTLEEPQDESTTATHETTANNRDALETLRDRYARGELTDEQFERKLERLLETETLENAEEWARDARDERDRNLEFET